MAPQRQIWSPSEQYLRKRKDRFHSGLAVIDAHLQTIRSYLDFWLELVTWLSSLSPEGTQLRGSLPLHVPTRGKRFMMDG